METWKLAFYFFQIYGGNAFHSRVTMGITTMRENEQMSA